MTSDQTFTALREAHHLGVEKSIQDCFLNKVGVPWLGLFLTFSLALEEFCRKDLQL